MTQEDTCSSSEYLTKVNVSSGDRGTWSVLNALPLSPHHLTFDDALNNKRYKPFRVGRHHTGCEIFRSRGSILRTPHGSYRSRLRISRRVQRALPKPLRRGHTVIWYNQRRLVHRLICSSLKGLQHTQEGSQGKTGYVEEPNGQNRLRGMAHMVI